MLANLDQRSAISVVDDRTIIAGSVTTVAEAIAVQRGTEPALAERGLIAARWPSLSQGSSISAILEPPDNWLSALERVTRRADGPSILQGAQTIGLSVESGSPGTVTLSIDVGNAALAARDAERIRHWVATPPEIVEAPWAEVLHSARVSARMQIIEVALDLSSLSKPR
jgi:hypothetical protein